MRGADALAVAGMLSMGTIKTLLSKLMYGIQARGIDGSVHSFEKPWYMCFNMFIGMAGCLLPSLVAALVVAVRRAGASSSSLREPLLAGDASAADGAAPAGAPAADPDARRPVKGLRGLMVVGAPTVADLLATTLSNIGLLYITVSVYQMLRGAVILWNTLFGVLFLGKKLNRLHYAGLLLAVSGIVIVGAASLLTEHANNAGAGVAPPPMSPMPMTPAPAPAPAPSADATWHGFSLRAALSPGARAAALRAGDPDAAGAQWVIVGMGLIIVSQLIQAAGMTMEEFLLRRYELSSTQLVGYEGGVGCLLMIGLFLPVVALLPGNDVGGVYENSLDTAYMIFHSPLIGGLLAIDLLAINLFNAAGMRITSSLGAVFRSVLEAVRTLNVWLLDLALYYYFTKGRLGEAWSTQWSWLQACGFVVLVSSALTYGRGNARAARLAADAAAAAEADALAAGDAAEAGEAAPASASPVAAASSSPAGFSPAARTPLGGPALPPLAQSLLGRNIPRPGSTPRSLDGGSPHAPGSGTGGTAIPRVGSRMSVTNSFVGSPMVSSRYFAEN